MPTQICAFSCRRPASIRQASADVGQRGVLEYHGHEDDDPEDASEPVSLQQPLNPKTTKNLTKNANHTNECSSKTKT